jgi:hypothetical protein
MPKKIACITVTLVMGFPTVGCHAQESSPWIQAETTVPSPSSQDASPNSDASSSLFRCKRSPAGWTQVSPNQWKSDFGMIVSIYADAQSDQVPSAYFWKTDIKNASQAQTILNQAKPGEEINVTQYFRQHEAWKINEPYPPTIPRKPGEPVVDLAPSPYQLHYLYRPARDWIFDQILARAKGFVTEKFDPSKNADIMVVVDGPYLPIFEGRFTQNANIFWFSANTSPYKYSYESIKEKLVLSSMRSRAVELKRVNDFLISCNAN